MTRNGVVCAGNWIVDIVHTIDHWPKKSDLARIHDAVTGIGGGAANVAMALKALRPDFPVWAAGRVGADTYGDQVVNTCHSAKISTEILTRDRDAPTAHTHVMTVPGDTRTFFYQGGANDRLGIEHVDAGAISKTTNAKLFYLGYLMLLARLDTLRADGTTMAADLLKAARDAGMTVCVDLVSAAHDDFSAIVRASLPHIDYLIVNEVEAGRVLDRPVATPHAMAAAARDLIELGVNEATIIHSATHAVWADNGMADVVTAPAVTVPPENIVGPVGACDAICEVILIGVHEVWTSQTSLAV
ncbi:MAG: carbohydrate kinase family protein, partial [Pseudomonadota bacterium]